MKISACVIVRNEERNIGNWLDNVMPIADEVVVVDTGSQDKTLDILHERGINVYHFPWCNDFAAAKNYAIEQATGDWIIFLDADEYLDNNSVQVFRSIMSDYHKHKKIGALMCQLINIDTDNMNKVIGSMMQVRVFRNISGIRYKGAVHEQLVASGKGLVMQYCKGLTIYHTGYSSSLVRQKAARNLPIMLEKEKSLPPGEHGGALLIFLMDAYNALGQYDKALEYAQKAVEAKVYTVGDESHAYKGVISAMSRLQMPPQEIFSVLDKAMEIFPKDVFFMIEKGHFFYVSKDYLVAAECFEKAILMYEEQKAILNTGKCIVDDAVSLLPLLYGELAAIYILRGRNQRALELTLQGLQIYKYNGLLVQNLYKLLSDKPVVEIIQVFKCFFVRNVDDGFLLNVLIRLASKEFFAYYGCGGNRISKLKMFLKTGNYAGGTVISKRSLRVWQHLAMAGVWQMEQDRQCTDAVKGMCGFLPCGYEPNSEKQDNDMKAVARLLQSVQ